jgi:hypothetical protein
VSVNEELERVNAEISRLMRYKRVLEDTLASKLLKRLVSLDIQLLTCTKFAHIGFRYPKGKQIGC